MTPRARRRTDYATLANCGRRFFDWRRNAVHIHTGTPDVETVEMPRRFRLPGCQVRYRDTSEPVPSPLAYSEACHYVIRRAPDGGETWEWRACHVTPSDS